MICIGIDPGTHTGVAVWDSREGKFLSLETLPVHRALEIVKEMASPFWHMDKLYNEKMEVVFEDARQRTWFGRGDTNAKAQGAGSVKRDWHPIPGETSCQGCDQSLCRILQDDIRIPGKDIRTFQGCSHACHR